MTYKFLINIVYDASPNYITTILIYLPPQSQRQKYIKVDYGAPDPNKTSTLTFRLWNCTSDPAAKMLQLNETDLEPSND